MKFKHLLLLLYTYYVLSLGYYTGYGLYKSQQEYFCTQKRPDHPNFIDVQYVDVVSNDMYPIESENNSRLVNFGGMFFNYYDKNDSSYNSFVSRVNDLWEKSLHINGVYVEIKCNPTNIYETWDHFSENETYWVFEDQLVLKIDEVGHMRVHNSNYGNNYHIPKSINRPPGKIECIESRAVETCSLPQEHSNKFFLAYLIFSSLYWFFSLLSIFDIKDYLLIRLANNLSSNLLRINLNGTLNFCNPVDGKPVKIAKGTKVFKLGNVDRFCFDGTEGLKTFKDLDGNYEILKTGVLYVGKTSRRFIKMEKSDLDCISKYFFAVTLDSLKCVLTNDEKHFMKTLDVIDNVARGVHLFECIKETDEMTLDVHEFEFKIIKQKFNVLKDSVVKKLLEHNWRFFQGKYEINSLILCLKRKCMSRDRPDGVGNSQWKRYGYDVKYILTGEGFKHSCQANFKPTQTLLSMDGIDFQTLQTIPLPEICMAKVKIGKNIDVSKCFNEIAADLPTKEVLSIVNYNNRIIRRNEDYFNSARNFHKLVNEVNESLIKKKNEVKSSDDLKRLAKEIRESLFKPIEYIMQKREDFEKAPFEMERRPKTIRYQKQDKNDLAPNCKKFSLFVKDVVKDIAAKADWVLDTENKFAVLDKIGEKIEKMNNKSDEKLYELNVKQYVDHIFKNAKVQKKRRLVRSEIKAKNRAVKEKAKKKVSSGDKCVKSSYISENFRSCFEAASKATYIEGCRPKTVCTIKAGMKKFIKINVEKSNLENEIESELNRLKFFNFNKYYDMNLQKSLISQIINDQEVTEDFFSVCHEVYGFLLN